MIEWTYKQARDAIHDVGCTIRRTQCDEWRVNLVGGTEATAYYAGSLDDAVNTARAMAKPAELATDCNGRPMIPAGTVVIVRTTNGGQITAALARNHYPTYDVAFEFCVIPSFRIASVVRAPAAPAES